jgi:hypothetical protein
MNEASPLVAKRTGNSASSAKDTEIPEEQLSQKAHV